MKSKYIVFNRDEFDKTFFDTLEAEKIEEIENVVALRLQDKFVVPAMQAYLDAVCNVMEILEEYGMPDENINLEDLTTVRDWAFHVTTAAREFKNKKIPD
jgi:hypothetical protein